MSGSNAKIEWFLARDGQQHGPLSDPELRKFIELGHLKPSDLVWRAGFPEWRTASEVFPEIRPAPAPPPPPQPEPEPENEPEPERDAPPSGAEAAQASLDSQEPADAEAQPASQARLETHDGAHSSMAPEARLPEARLPEPRVEVSPEQQPASAQRADLQQDAGNDTTAQPGQSGRPTIADGQEGARAPGPSMGQQAGPSIGHPLGQAPDMQARHTPYGQPQHQQPHGPAPVQPYPGQQGTTGPGGHPQFAPQGPQAGAGQPYGHDPRGHGHPHAMQGSAMQGPGSGPQLRPDMQIGAQQHPGGGFHPGAAQPGGPGYGAPGHAARGQGAPGQGAPGQDPAFDDEFYEDYEDEPKRRPYLAVAALLAFVGIIGAGGWFAYANQALLTQIISDFTREPVKQSPAVIAAPEKPTKTAVATQPVAQQTERQGAADTQSAPLAILQSSFWQALKAEDGEWAQRQEKAIAQLQNDGKTGDEVLAFAVNAIVDWRRSHADKILTASPEHLRSLAKSFVANLKFLVGQNVQACYGFISKGELSPAVLPFYKEPQQAKVLGTQMQAIIAAARNDGGESTQYLEPEPPDFNVLAQMLLKRGWSEADLKLFSDPGALSTAPAEKVCKLVTEWFDTQLQMQPGEQQMRLLATSLQPVVRG